MDNQFGDNEPFGENEEMVVLSKEWYERIMAGVDIRKTFHEKFEDYREVRVAAGILMVMFESFPVPITNTILTDTLNKKQFVVMEDGAFRQYVKEFIQSKSN